jgi:ABC-type amino acid transport substrate-binding protein
MEKTVGALCLVAAFLLPAGSVTAAETLRLTTQEWEPYQFTKDGQLSGVAVEVVRCIAGKLGVAAELSVKPWVRAQKMVEDGDADGFFAASRSAERDAYATMSDPIAPQVWRWYLQASGDKDPSKADGLRVGVLRGSAMEKFLADSKYLGVTSVTTSGQLVELLQMNRVDAALANELVFAEAAEDAKIPASSFKSVEHSNRPLGVYFGKAYLAKHEGFLPSFNAAIAGCRK